MSTITIAQQAADKKAAEEKAQSDFERISGIHGNPDFGLDILQLEKMQRSKEQAMQRSIVEDRISNMELILQQLFPSECWDDGARQTAERWLRAMDEFKPEPEIDFTFTTFPSKVNQMIVVKDIEFSSLCAHHLFPFQGVAHVGYLPNKLMVGLSKIPRTVLHFAHRPQTQETLTEQIASFLKSRLEAQGVAVVIESQHTCMSCRGVLQYNATMVTSEMRGTFLTSGDARAEFQSAIRSR